MSCAVPRRRCQVRPVSGIGGSRRLTHPGLVFRVDVPVGERDGRYMATADLGEDSGDVGVGDTPQVAVQEALRSLGETSGDEMAARV